MNQLLRKRKVGKMLLTGMLSLAMITQPMTAFAAASVDIPDTTPETSALSDDIAAASLEENETKVRAADKKTFTEAQIAANDYVLYLANCGTTDPSVVPSGSNRGLYQSNVDQEYGEDAGTGLIWGYQPNDENTQMVKGGSGTSLTGSYVYMSENITFKSGTSGFKYDFELPERAGNEYEVTVGISVPNWWGTKNVEVVMEGETVAQKSCPQNQLTEIKQEVTVTDQELNVMVHNPNAGSRGEDPVLSYIIVKAVPSGDVESLQVLQELINTYQSKIEGNSYSEETKAEFDKAVEEAQKLIDEKCTDEEEIAAASDALKEAYEGLFLLNIQTYTSFTGTNGVQMYDTSGYKIQAHGGQIQKIGDTYYWIGEDRSNGYRPMPGVHLYSSQDLYNWTDQGVVLRTMDSYEQFETDDYFKSLYGDLSEAEKKEIYVDLWAEGCVMERPKMLYNENTKQYVIWFHADGTSPYETGSGSNYAKAKAGVAVADNPAGPYKLVGSYMLASDYSNHGFDSVGGHVRDMNVFKDDDGKAYVMYSSEGNAVMYIARLNDSYTGLAKPADQMVLGEDFAISSTDSREAPAMFKYQGKYYLITSGCTGWAPNQARYAVADSPLGPWTNKGDPCVGDSNHTTFQTQSTCVIPVDAENGKFIYMGDRWLNPDSGGDLSDSRYVWLPIEFGSDNTIMIKDYSDWTLDELEGKGSISIDTELPQTTDSISKLMASLPGKLDVTIGQKAYKDAEVTWSIDEEKASLGDYVLGNVAVTGTLEALNKEFTLNVFCCPTSLMYFADCYTNNDENTSEIFNQFSEYADDLQNTVSDQAYGNDNGIYWGYTSTPGASGGSSSQDMGSKGSGDFYDCGWWATGSGKIEYSFELNPGSYVVATGYHEWWSSTRGIKVTASSVDASGNATEIGTTTFTLSGEQDLQKQTQITVPEDSDHVLVTVSKASGSDPVLSWIGIVSTSEKEEKENLIVNGSFENGSDGWSLGEGASVQEAENAPDGTHYLQDNGNKYSWGDGSSQSVAVKPDTEYVLTGSVKVSSNTPYWVGANVDGKEIYCVASGDSSYTDNTDTDKKLAYQVAAGATDWTDFEVRFTTGSETSSVNIYTWAGNGGYGYLDNLILTEVTGNLDWTAFDEKISEIESLDKEEYTTDSWAEFQKVVAEAKEFKENATDATKQREIRLMVAKLEAAMGELISIHEPTGDVTYYVDAENGDDSNDGTSPETAWKTLTKASSIRKLTEGGSILLKAGCVWNGEQLSVKNAEGTAEHPIIIGSYGEGAKPIINGNGANWSGSRKEQLAAVHILNCENIVVENLEITNWDSSVSGEYAQSSKLLSGLVVENRDAGELFNTVIRNNKIHDVNGRMAGGSEKAAGGLIAVVTGEGSNHTGKIKSWFNGLTIDGNEVYKVCHEAIYMESVWASRTLVGGSSSDTGYQNAGNSTWVGSSDVLIENNYVHDVAGDGIVPINTNEALVQYNLIDNSADSRWDYSSNPNHAALWTWDSNNVTFRYNEACNTSKASVGTAVGNDSMAFDFDYGVQNCLYEYNYSHDNLGGFLMLCPGPGATINNIARYNVSVNDGLYDGAPIIRLGTGKYGSIGVQIYNNTMYWAESGYTAALMPHSAWEGTVISDVSVFNNIFYGPAKEGSVSTQSGISYYNNCVYGGSQDVYQASVSDENVIAEDPMFVDVKDYTTGSWSDGKTTLGTVNGFKINENSPCINAGADYPDAPNSSTDSLKNELVENTVQKPVKDYYGVALADGKADIGASEYAAEPVVVIDKSELEALIKKAEETDKTLYTEQSYEQLMAVLAIEKEVYNNEDATQQEVDIAAGELKAALDALEKRIEPVDPDKVDKTNLQNLYDTSLEKAENDYTTATWKVLVEAQKKAVEVLANENATKEEVSEAYNALAEAINGLKKVHVIGPTDPGKDEGNTGNGTSNGGNSSVNKGSDTSNTSNSSSAAVSNKKGSTSVRTGDSTPIALYVICAVIALAAIGGLVIMRRKRNR